MTASLRQSLADADSSNTSQGTSEGLSVDVPSTAGVFFDVMNASVTLHSLNVVVVSTTAQPTTASSSVTSNNTVNQSLTTAVTTAVSTASTLGYNNISVETAIYDANMTVPSNTSTLVTTASYNVTLTTVNNATRHLTSVTTVTSTPSPQSHDNFTDVVITTDATMTNTSTTE